jgi:hypothetical protein
MLTRNPMPIATPSLFVGALILCGFAAEASSSSLYGDNMQSANAVLSDCVVLNVGGSAETVDEITIWYYDTSLDPHVLTKTTRAQTVQPGSAVYVQSGYSVPISEGILVPSTSCAVRSASNTAFRAVMELRDVNGNTIINEPLRAGSASLFSDNMQSANATLSDCVALNVGSTAQTVDEITIWYYDGSLNPHVLVQTTGAQTVQPGSAVNVQSGYSVPNSQGLLNPSTSCAVSGTDNASFRGVIELRDVNGNTIINEALH